MVASVAIKSILLILRFIAIKYVSTCAENLSNVSGQFVCFILAAVRENEEVLKTTRREV